MSKTNKHQQKYKYKHYWDDKPSRWWTRFCLLADEYSFRAPPEPKDINEPRDWGHFGIELRRAKPIRKNSKRRHRALVRRLLHEGKYDDVAFLKPENVDWEIW